MVLSLAPVSEDQGRTYYRQENYYSRDQAEEYSRWWGKGAETFGLSGEIIFEDFDKLLLGKSPDGTVLTASKNLKKPDLSVADKEQILRTIAFDLKEKGVDALVNGRVLAMINSALGEQRLSTKRMKAVVGQALKEFSDLTKPQKILFRRLLSKHLSPAVTPQRRAAIDLTFSAPKSISIQALLFEKQDLVDAHRRSVEVALKIIEQRYSNYRTREQEKRITRVSGKLTVAQFEHDTSRAKDPNLHTHNVVMNLLEAGKAVDGRPVYRAIHNDILFQNSKLGGVIYKNELARECLKLGYELIDHGNGAFDLKGSSREQLDAFSKRRQQILDAGGTDAVSSRDKVLVDRASKGSEVPRETLQSIWTAEAETLALKEIELSKSPLVLPKRSLREAVTLAIKQVSERSSSFRKEELELATLQNNLGFFTFDKVQAAVHKTIGREIFASTTEGRYVSIYSVKIEQDYRRLAGMQLNNRLPLMKPEMASETVKKLVQLALEERGRAMTSGQKRAILDTLQSRHGIVIWQGVAGAGKTDSLRPLVELLEKEGYDVKGFAQAASAAKQLSEGAGIKAVTLETMLVQNPLTPGPTDKPQFWVVDEAGFISSRDMLRLMEYQKTTGARILLIGDTRQLSAVEAGNPFLDLQRNVLKKSLSELNESVRQKDPKLKEAVAMLNKGRTADGLRHLESKINVVNAGKRPEAVARYYLSLSDHERERSIVVARTNVERYEITEKIQAGLKKEGKLGTEEKLLIHERKDIGRYRLAIAAAVREGDLFVPNKDITSLGLKRNEAYEIIARDTLENSITLSVGSKIETVKVDLRRYMEHSFFEKREITIHEGDRLAWTRNQRGEDRINGDMIKVLSIMEGEAKIRYDSGREEIIDLSKRHFLDHAIVITTNKSQGLSRWRNIVSVDNGKFKEALYVDITRAVGDIAIFCSDKDQLYKHAEISASNTIATEIVADLQELKTRLEGLYNAAAPISAGSSAPEEGMHMDPDHAKDFEPDSGPDFGI